VRPTVMTTMMVVMKYQRKKLLHPKQLFVTSHDWYAKVF
jgi:hypothetical protein